MDFSGISTIINASSGAVNSIGNSTSSIIGAAGNYQGTIDCGSRPSCLGWSKGCREKQQGYYDCVKLAATAKYNPENARAIASTANSNRTLLLVGGGIVALVVIILLLRK